MSDQIAIRKRILRSAEDIVCADRNGRYGEPEDNFGVIGDLWSAYINARYKAGIMIDPSDVGVMMALFKIGRLSTAMDMCEDCYVDAAGYLACAGAIDAEEEEDEDRDQN